MARRLSWDGGTEPEFAAAEVVEQEPEAVSSGWTNIADVGGGAQGPAGPAGKSAYQTWVEAVTGSTLAPEEEEWVNTTLIPVEVFVQPSEPTATEDKPLSFWKA